MWKYLFLILVFFASCKKEKQEVIPTIYPLSYLPVYPGSYWKYVNLAGDTVIQSTAPNYELHQYAAEKIYGYITDPVYVPFWNGSPVYGYSTPLQPSDFMQSSGFIQIGYLSEKEGDEWTTNSSKLGYISRIVGNTDTSIIINSINYNNVVIVRNYTHVGQPRFSRLTAVSYYAKNIGLIKEEHFDFDSTLTNRIEITSYYINH